MPDTLSNIVADANLVLSFGQRAGLLRNDDLIDALGACAANPAATLLSPQGQAVQKALNKAVADIAPTTIFDLRRYDPFAQNSLTSIGGETMKVIFALVVGLLIALTASQTVTYTRGSEILVQLRGIITKDPLAMMASTARESASVTAKEPVEASLLANLYGDVEKLKALSSSVDVTIESAQTFTTANRFMAKLYPFLGLKAPITPPPLGNPDPSPNKEAESGAQNAGKIQEPYAKTASTAVSSSLVTAADTPRNSDPAKSPGGEASGKAAQTNETAQMKGGGTYYALLRRADANLRSGESVLRIEPRQVAQERYRPRVEFCLRSKHVSNNSFASNYSNKRS